jgi:hypothetical protein
MWQSALCSQSEQIFWGYRTMYESLPHHPTTVPLAALSTRYAIGIRSRFTPYFNVQLKGQWMDLGVSVRKKRTED